MTENLDTAWRPHEPAQRGPAADDSEPPYEDGYICGTGLDDPENASWTHEVYATREEAVAAGNNGMGWRGDQAESDDMGEAMLENWQDKVFGQNGALLDELQETLDKVWSDFEDKHGLWSWGIWFDDVEGHEFAPESTKR